jgi:hypothetical protein
MFKYDTVICKSCHPNSKGGLSAMSPPPKYATEIIVCAKFGEDRFMILT